jgi:hypothetical protein
MNDNGESGDNAGDYLITVFLDPVGMRMNPLGKAGFILRFV